LNNKVNIIDQEQYFLFALYASQDGIQNTRKLGLKSGYFRGYSLGDVPEDGDYLSQFASHIWHISSQPDP
jgi:hypothetical protein